MRINPLALAVPVAAAFVGVWQLSTWYREALSVTVSQRRPGQDDRAPVDVRDPAFAARNPGRLTRGDGSPAALDGAWPQFRGPNRDGIAPDRERALTTWPPGGPTVLWRVPVGEGHAGPAVWRGRVYLVDYDRDRQEDAIRCLSLDDGREIWRYTYAVQVKRNHGMSRTVPAVADGFLLAMGPKCHVHCLNADTGELVWKMDLVRRFGTVVPPWYAGQCPLIDNGRAILAPGGTSLMVAVDLPTGEVVWQVENPDQWAMTHSSIMPVEAAGVRQYVYCGSRGVIGVAAADGNVLWTWPEWKISIANIPSPVPVPPDRLFLTGGYGAGSQVVRLSRDAEAFAVEQVLRLKPADFASEQQTPVLHRDHLYGVAYDGQLVCLDLLGNRLWASGPAATYGLGPYLLVDGVLYVLSDQSGELVMVEAAPAGYRELGRAKVLDGHDAWGPMAVADGRLLLRDLAELVCLQIGPAAGDAAEPPDPASSAPPAAEVPTGLAEAAAASPAREVPLGWSGR